jgi:RNA polymerase sigma-70 factor (ECF subfamily)
MDDERFDLTALDDASLARQFKQTRDNRYFAALFDRYQKKVYALCYRVFGSESPAEDAVQETFTRAFEQINNFNEAGLKSNFYAWLCRIARNACFDKVRKIRVRTKHKADAEVSSAPTVGNDFYHPAEVQVWVGEIMDKISKLDDEPRMCFLLFYVEGCTYEEITRITGFGVKDVKNHLRTARRHLERLLK